MTALIAALISAYKANGTLMALTAGGISQGPSRNADFDYVTLQALPGAVIPTYADKPLADVTVTFSVWCERGGAQAATIADAVMDYFKGYMPTLSRGSVTNVNLSRPPIVIPQVRRSENNKTVHMINVEFKYHGVIY